MLRTIVVGVGPSTSSFDALSWAIDRAASAGAELIVATAVVAPLPVGGPSCAAVSFGDRDEMVESIAEWQRTVVDEQTGCWSRSVVRRHLVRVGRPVELLLQASHGADLLVLGGDRRGRLSPVSRRCLRVASCPVVVVQGGRPR